MKNTKGNQPRRAARTLGQAVGLRDSLEAKTTEVLRRHRLDLRLAGGATGAGAGGTPIVAEAGHARPRSGS